MRRPSPSPFSTLMTSAPRSASRRPAAGPATDDPSSRTRMPSSGGRYEVTPHEVLERGNPCPCCSPRRRRRSTPSCSKLARRASRSARSRTRPSSPPSTSRSGASTSRRSRAATRRDACGRSARRRRSPRRARRASPRYACIRTWSRSRRTRCAGPASRWRRSRRRSLGQAPLKTRLAEVRAAVADGADEIDMVINRGAFLAGEFGEVQDEIGAVVEALRRRRAQGDPGGERTRRRTTAIRAASFLAIAHESARATSSRRAPARLAERDARATIR